MRYKGRTTARKALLETDEILLRGDPRIVIKRAEVTRVESKNGVLRKGGDVELTLGEQSEKWANDILHPKSRIDKLGVKPGQTVVLTGVTDKALAGELAARGARVVRSAKAADVVFVEANKVAELSKVVKAAASIAPTGAVWVLTPRGVEGLKDTDVMRVGKAAGLVDVKVVRFSDTHSANKFMVPKSKR